MSSARRRRRFFFRVVFVFVVGRKTRFFFRSRRVGFVRVRFGFGFGFGFVESSRRVRRGVVVGRVVRAAARRIRVRRVFVGIEKSQIVAADVRSDVLVHRVVRLGVASEFVLEVVVLVVLVLRLGLVPGLVRLARAESRAVLARRAAGARRAGCPLQPRALLRLEPGARGVRVREGFKRERLVPRVPQVLRERRAEVRRELRRRRDVGEEREPLQVRQVPPRLERSLFVASPNVFRKSAFLSPPQNRVRVVRVRCQARAARGERRERRAQRHTSVRAFAVRLFFRGVRATERKPAQRSVLLGFGFGFRLRSFEARLRQQREEVREHCRRRDEPRDERLADRATERDASLRESNPLRDVVELA